MILFSQRLKEGVLPQGRIRNYFPLLFKELYIKSEFIHVTLSVAEGLGAVGDYYWFTASPTPRFFVASFTLSEAHVLLRMTFDARPFQEVKMSLRAANGWLKVAVSLS